MKAKRLTKKELATADAARDLVSRIVSWKAEIAKAEDQLRKLGVSGFSVFGDDGKLRVRWGAR